MPNYIQITDGLCLVEQEIKTKKVIKKREPVNHIWIYDRSGSMYWLLPELTAQLIKLSQKLPLKDTLTLGWFSGEGDFNWVFKGFKITEKSDYKALERAIKANSSSRNTTCFSEILEDTQTVINDLSVFSDIFSLHFFTDGYPVVSNYRQEVDNIFKAINSIKGKVHTAMYVGYGAYYNKDLLNQMSERLGAMLIHSSMIPEYADTITRLIKMTQNLEPKEEVEPLISDPLAIYTVTNQGVILYSIDDRDSKLYISPDKKGASVYYLSTDKPNKKSWKKVTMDDINFGDEDDRLSKSLYAGALVLTQQAKTDIAMEIIGKIGDKKIVDDLTNAFTIEEYGAAEDTINYAITDISKRFQNGRDTNYLPPVDAFCVFDLLNMLMEDSEACFYPYHEKFKYERIGVGSKAKEGYPDFHADRSSKCPFSSLTWHEDRLNLSVLTRVNGTIDLHEIDGTKPEDLGFSVIYPTFVFRNFTFIKDGRVHTKKFYISSSQKTYGDLKNKGLIFDDTFSNNGIYGVDITKLPAVNRAIATGKTSATELCHMAMHQQELKAKIKSLKWLKKEEYGDETTAEVGLSDDQKVFLEAHGIQVSRGGSFSPPTEKEDAKDKYMAKSFKIKIAGLSSLPTVKKVRDKIASGKSRTSVEGLIEDGINVYSSINADNKLKKIEETLSDYNDELKKIRTRIQENKFSVILGRKWFDEFQSREEGTLEVNGKTYTFNLDEVAVDI